MHPPSPPDFAFGVIILGAGASSRMGRPKLLLPWEDTTVIGQLLHQWRAVDAGQIAVVMAGNDESLDKELNRLAFSREDRIVNPEPARGMFSSIICAASWSGWDSNLTHWVIVLGDQPHLATGTLQKLLDFARQHPGSICQPSYGGHARHPVVLPRMVLSELRETGAVNLREFLHGIRSLLNECSVDDPGLALDMDTPEDYQQLIKYYPSGT